MPTHTHRFNEPLSAGAVRALRKAETVCFRYQPNRDYLGERVGVIECTMKGKLHGKEVETYINIEVNTTVYDYDRLTSPALFEQYNDELRCFESVSYASHSQEWQSIAANFKTGDILELYWERNANSEGMEDKEMACDQLKLKIERGDKALSFLIDKNTLPRHSTARMIKYEGWVETKFTSRCWRKEHEKAAAQPAYA